jgi:hypothetical protein
MICKKCKKNKANEKKDQYNINLANIFDTNFSYYCNKCLDHAYHAAAVIYWDNLGELNDNRGDIK